MPTIPIDRIETVTTPVVGQRYLTWRPGQNSEIVQVDEIRGSTVRTTGGRSLSYVRSARRWALVNPAPVVGRHYVLVEDSLPDCYVRGMAGDVVYWQNAPDVTESYYGGQKIAKRVSDGESVFVHTWVNLTHMPYPEHVVTTASMTSTATVRVVSSRHPQDIGLLMRAHIAYNHDISSVGVVVESTGFDMVWPDPGPGPYAQPTVIPSYAVIQVGTTGGHEAVRIIASRTPEAVGRRMTGLEAYRLDREAAVVIVDAVGDSRFHAIPDPGDGPYRVESAEPPCPFTVGDRVVYIGSDVWSWTAPIYGTVTNTSATSVSVRADDEQAITGSRSQRIYFKSLMPAEDYVDVRPICETCERQSCACVECYSCGEVMRRYDDDVIHSGGRDAFVHTNCGATCDYCDNTVFPDDLSYCDDTEESYCQDCVTSCDSCGESIHPANSYCDGCIRRRDNGVRSYGHTHPERWLGGPLPKNADGHHVGFYIGFELEVSSTNYDDMTALRDWSENHLGFRDALDPKEDGSVDGFEIATQPMTPEFFEAVNWDSFFEMLEEHSTWDESESREPDAHGLHVHIGRVAFERDDIATAMFTYLLGQGQGRHLERIGRRNATHYCSKVAKPASTALVSMANRKGGHNVQTRRIERQGGVYAGRDAINLANSGTIEIRAFRSTREAEHLKAAVRTVYLAARYIAHLRGSMTAGQHGRGAGGFVSPKALHWDSFVTWVEQVMPEAAAALREPKPVPVVAPEPVVLHGTAEGILRNMSDLFPLGA